jgi:hypothetical protein
MYPDEVYLLKRIESEKGNHNRIIKHETGKLE